MIQATMRMPTTLRMSNLRCYAPRIFITSSFLLFLIQPLGTGHGVTPSALRCWPLIGATEGILGSWLSKAFTARGHEAVELSRDSGSFPRCDRVIASVLCRQETLKSNFGLRIQAYVEKCEIADENVRGRYILNIIASEFDTANVATSITTSFELFQLPAPQDGVHGLRHWHDKVTYILSQLSVQQRPAEDMLAHWAYNSLKKHAFMRRVIDRYQEFPTFRTF